MKILLTLYKYFPWGGLQKDTMRVIEEAVARGHEVEVLTTSWDYPKPQGNVCITLVQPQGFSNHTRMENFSISFQQRLAKGGIDVSLAMNRVAGADFYFAADSCMKLYLPKKHSALALRLLPRYRAVLRQEARIFEPPSHTKIMYIADIQRKEFKEAYGIGDDRLICLPPGMNPKCVRPANADEIRSRKRQELGLNENDAAIILVGTNYMRKGVDRVLAAIAALPQEQRSQLRFFLAGNDDTVKVNKLAAKYEVASNFTHLGPRDDVDELLLASDLMVHPAREEGTGTVLVEALASGLPVICSAACGFCTYVNDATATVTPEPFSQADLNKMLKDALINLPRLKSRTIQYASSQDFTARTKTILDCLEG